MQGDAGGDGGGGRQHSVDAGGRRFAQSPSGGGSSLVPLQEVQLDDDDYDVTDDWESRSSHIYYSSKDSQQYIREKLRATWVVRTEHVALESVRITATTSSVSSNSSDGDFGVSATAAAFVLRDTEAYSKSAQSLQQQLWESSSKSDAGVPRGMSSSGGRKGGGGGSSGRSPAGSITKEQYIGLTGELFVFDKLKALLPGFDDSCWASSARTVSKARVTCASRAATSMPPSASRRSI
jgi:hypothetical protein